MVDRQQALAQAAEQLAGNADQALADILYKVLQGIDKNHLFSVGGEPVLIGMARPQLLVRSLMWRLIMPPWRWRRVQLHVPK